MEHDFEAATMRLFGDVYGVRIVGQNGNCERIRKREDRLGGALVLPKIDEDDGEARSGRRGCNFDRGNRCFRYVNCVSWDIAVEIFEGESFAGFDHGASREFVARSDVIEGLENERPVGVGCAFVRRWTNSDGDVIGASWSAVCGVKTQTRGDI